MANDNIVTLGNDNFESEVGSETPILVDFWAAWCGPCRMVAPVLDQLADEYEGQIKIGKLDIDEYQEIASRFHVRSIPTFILFESGEVKDRMEGMVPKSSFERFINKNVPATADAAS